MGIFDALTTSVAGLQAQAFALQNISGNIANSQTTGYKETNTSFQDLVSAASAQQTTSSGVIASSVATNSVQGTIQSTTVSTDMAINGSGYFVVAQPTGTADNQPQFSGVDYYTRAGDFELNSGGYLVNGSGYYLMGVPINSSTGNPVGSSPQVLQFSNDFVPAQQTTAFTYQANLPTSPTGGMLVSADYAANPLAGAPAAAQITGTGATLSPDAVATGTGSAGSLTAGTTLASLGIASGDTITINDGTHATVLVHVHRDRYRRRSGYRHQCGPYRRHSQRIREPQRQRAIWSSPAPPVPLRLRSAARRLRIPLSASAQEPTRSLRPTC